MFVCLSVCVFVCLFVPKSDSSLPNARSDMSFQTKPPRCFNGLGLCPMGCTFRLWFLQVCFQRAPNLGKPLEKADFCYMEQLSPWSFWGPLHRICRSTPETCRVQLCFPFQLAAKGHRGHSHVKALARFACCQPTGVLPGSGPQGKSPYC